MAFAAVITPESTSDNADSESLATNGAAAIESGMIAAVGPMLVRTIMRENGINKIISMMKGSDLRIFTILESALYVSGLGRRPAGDVLYKYAPSGKPIKHASRVETMVM